MFDNTAEAALAPLDGMTLADMAALDTEQLRKSANCVATGNSSPRRAAKAG